MGIPRCNHFAKFTLQNPYQSIPRQFVYYTSVVDKIIVPQMYPNTKYLWIWYLKWQKDFEGVIKDFWHGAITLGLNLTTSILIRGRERSRVRERKYQSGSKQERRCYTDSFENEGKGPRSMNVVASSSWKGQGYRLFPRVPRSTSLPNTLVLA